MNPELIYFLASLIATILLILLAVRSYRLRRLLPLTFAILGFLSLQAASALVLGSKLRGYVYCTVDPEATFLECPFKGLTYERMLAHYRDAKGGTQLFRTFNKDWWNFYRWHDYSSHPRWKLPFRPNPQSKDAPSRAS